MVESGTTTCEIYDPNLGTWTFTAEEMAYGRTRPSEHAASRWDRARGRGNSHTGRSGVIQPARPDL